MRPVQSGISGEAQQSVVARPIEGGAVSDSALSSFEAARSAPPPDGLRHAVLRANADERRVIALQVAWLGHKLAGRAEVDDRSARDAAPHGMATGTGVDLAFDKSALRQAWRVRFPHLLDGARIGAVARDLVTWCAVPRGQTSVVPYWHWLSSTEEAASDVQGCARLPMREWPVALLSVALTLSNLRNAVLPDLSMPNGDLRGVIAPGAQFGGGHFGGAWWAGAALANAGFAYSNQVNADFEGADLRGACFHAADMSGARLVAADLRCAELRHTAMCGTDLSEARCQGLLFAQGRLDGASFHRTKLQDASFAGGTAHGAKWIGAKAKRSRWTSVAMRNGQAIGADLRSAEFRQCEFPGWDARGAKLNGASFEACDLRHARFCGASLKHVRIGARCNLAGTQWQGARVRLDAAWLRHLTSSELDNVVQSLATFPLDQPAARASIFMQLLTALARPAGILDNRREMAPRLERLPASVQRSDWLGRLLVSGSEAGGIGEHDDFAELRAQWLKRTLHELTDERWLRARADWGTASLMKALHWHCGNASPQAVWSLAGAMCQTLYWAEEGMDGVGGTRAQALRSAWFDALPSQVHVALSADGIDAFDASYVVLIGADGGVAARLPRHLLAGVLGTGAGDAARDGDLSCALDTLPGWRWIGTRVIARDAASPDDFVPGSMSQLQGLLRAFGFLATVWPVEPPLAPFVRLVGRWFGTGGVNHANAACHGAWDPSHAVVGAVSMHALPAALSTADRLDAVVRSARSPNHVQLRRAGRTDMEDVFREIPFVAPDGEAPLSTAMARRVRWVSVVAGLSWLAVQPERRRDGAIATGASVAPSGDAEPADRMRAYCDFALAALNETMRGDAESRHLPQALALRECLAGETRSAQRLAERLADWLTCPAIAHLPGLAQACRQTLPWFWAIRLPLGTEAIRRATRSRRDAGALDAPDAAGIAGD
ncbi:pentapeptide repeat-containing protein [Pandoraea terrigena]|uniref:Secreted effector protein PipB2 n=1 Tax=Pandoraea terrigena TaxID=2508292 RepID=A0A5E4YY73_9BURK|nr:pentapeptide repeat-containing protein [Pandoraea terrigena]VVE53746.1 Secreted effector protein PipB2 [Pandoraea terrigena]